MEQYLYLLKQGGWKWASGDMFNPYYYLKPSVVNKGSGILGVDMFACPADVVKHLKIFHLGQIVTVAMTVVVVLVTATVPKLENLLGHKTK